MRVLVPRLLPTNSLFLYLLVPGLLVQASHERACLISSLDGFDARVPDTVRRLANTRKAGRQKVSHLNKQKARCPCHTGRGQHRVRKPLFIPFGQEGCLHTTRYVRGDTFRSIVFWLATPPDARITQISWNIISTKIMFLLFFFLCTPAVGLDTGHRVACSFSPGLGFCVGIRSSSREKPQKAKPGATLSWHASLPIITLAFEPPHHLQVSVAIDTSRLRIRYAAHAIQK